VWWRCAGLPFAGDLLLLRFICNLCSCHFRLVVVRTQILVRTKNVKFDDIVVDIHLMFVGETVRPADGQYEDIV
jgi:hypothetical protein